MKTVTYQTLRGFRAVGIEPGTPFCCNPPCPFGFVEGAGKTIGEALFEALGKDAGHTGSPGALHPRGIP